MENVFFYPFSHSTFIIQLREIFFFGAPALPLDPSSRPCRPKFDKSGNFVVSPFSGVLLLLTTPLDQFPTQFPPSHLYQESSPKIYLTG